LTSGKISYKGRAASVGRGGIVDGLAGFLTISSVFVVIILVEPYIKD
jgi:hypothetical protein